ncbi:hypothetical protein D046_2103B, partial [Vibrio parahaemolyticus V-223/04]
KAMWMISKA